MSIIIPSLKEIGVQTQARLTHAEFSPLNINFAKRKNNTDRSMNLNTPAGCNSFPNSIQIDLEFCEEMSAEVSAFLYNCDLE